jgi:hypothetical protein
MDGQPVRSGNAGVFMGGGAVLVKRGPREGRERDCMADVLANVDEVTEARLPLRRVAPSVLRGRPMAGPCQ